jgi:hypothetical protein
LLGGKIESKPGGGVRVVVEEPGIAKVRHLLESQWIKGNQVWTKEHEDIDMAPGIYEPEHQVEFDPYEEEIRKVQD